MAEFNFAELCANDPELDGYLVISHRGEQAEIRTNMFSLMNAMPSLLTSQEAKETLLKLASSPRAKKSSEAQKKAWQSQLKERVLQLEFAGDSQIEIRFRKLNYEQIGRLQTEELVDCERTPQTSASIRIVLGSLRDLSRQWESCEQSFLSSSP